MYTEYIQNNGVPEMYGTLYPPGRDLNSIQRETETSQDSKDGQIIGKADC